LWRDNYYYYYYFKYYIGKDKIKEQKRRRNFISKTGRKGTRVKRESENVGRWESSCGSICHIVDI